MEIIYLLIGVLFTAIGFVIKAHFRYYKINDKVVVETTSKVIDTFFFYIFPIIQIILWTIIIPLSKVYVLLITINIASLLVSLIMIIIKRYIKFQKELYFSDLNFQKEQYRSQIEYINDTSQSLVNLIVDTSKNVIELVQDVNGISIDEMNKIKNDQKDLESMLVKLKKNVKAHSLNKLIENDINLDNPLEGKKIESKKDSTN